ncbi:MAG TPA: hypothetical protein PKD90_02535 [Phnomibacter sp.]|nr:hypothetical protein [Phnomibacter sp.]
MKKALNLMVAACLGCLAANANSITSNEKPALTGHTQDEWAICRAAVRATTTCPDGASMYILHGDVFYDCDSGAILGHNILTASVAEACAGHGGNWI